MPRFRQGQTGRVSPTASIILSDHKVAEKSEYLVIRAPLN